MLAEAAAQAVNQQSTANNATIAEQLQEDEDKENNSTGGLLISKETLAAEL